MRKEKTLGLDKKKVTAVERSITVLGFYILVLILSLRKLWVFSIYGFPKENIVFIVSYVLIDLLVVLSVKDPNVMLA